MPTRNPLSSPPRPYIGDHTSGAIGLDEPTVHSTDESRGARLVTILAGLSLAINLLAAGAYVGSTYFAAHQGRAGLVERRFADLARKLDVDPETDAGLTQLHRSVRVALDVRHIRNQPLMDDILAEFAKPTPDPARIGALQDAALSIRRATGNEALAALMTFLKQATPEERAKLLDLLGDHKDQDTMPLRFGVLP